MREWYGRRLLRIVTVNRRKKVEISVPLSYNFLLLVNGVAGENLISLWEGRTVAPPFLWDPAAGPKSRKLNFQSGSSTVKIQVYRNCCLPRAGLGGGGRRVRQIYLWGFRAFPKGPYKGKSRHRADQTSSRMSSEGLIWSTIMSTYL